MAAPLAAGRRRDGIVRADKIRLLLGAAVLRRRDVRPAVVRHFMAVPHDCLTGARMALDRKAWNEPGGADAVRLEQSEDALRAEKPELPARERGRAGHAAGDEPGLRIDVEGQTDEAARHTALPNVDTGAIRVA